MYRSIMVPLDGSAFGEHALPLALTIAQRSGAVVRLVHVHAASELVYMIGGAPMAEELSEVPDREAELAYLDNLTQRLVSSWGVDVISTLLDGPPTLALRDYAVEHAASLVVMSTHGRRLVSRFWLGSVADALVRQAPMPVLVVRPHQEAIDLIDLAQERAARRILIPLDGSALAEDALAHAVELGQLMEAEFTLLQAIDPIVMDYAPVARSAGLDERLVDAWRAEAQEYLDTIAAQLRVVSLRVHTSVAIAPPAVAILDYARQHPVDLIAMSTHARAGVSRMLLGSVANKVVRGAGAPVLLHRPRAAL